MGQKLKTLLIGLGVILAVIWHHQATLFQRQVRENLNMLQLSAGPSVQLGDIIISKYLFKVEFKKSQIDINNQSIEKIKQTLNKQSGFAFQLIHKQLDTLSPTFRLSYRLADRLVISYNPFWNELTLTSLGDSELSVQTLEEKIDLLAPDHNDLNQGKIKIALPDSWWMEKIKRFFSKNTVTVLTINSSCRNIKIVTAADQEAIYTQDYSLIKLNIDKEWLEGKQYYTFNLGLDADNIYFSPTLTKIWPFLESYVLSNKTKQQESFKLRIAYEEGKTFVETLMSQLEQGQKADWKPVFEVIPTLKGEVKSTNKNDAFSFMADYQVDYQPDKNYLKAAGDFGFEAYASWPAYFKKLWLFYQRIVAYPHTKTVSKPINTPVWYSVIENLKDKGEIKTGFLIELTDMNSDQLQAQGALKMGLEKSGMVIRGECKAPSLLTVEIDFEDVEAFLNKIYSHLLNSLQGPSHKVAELILPGIKSNLIETIQKLSLVKNEAQPLLRTIAINFNTKAQSLEIAGQPVHHEFLDIVKMIIGLREQHDFLQGLKKLIPSTPVTQDKPIALVP